MAIQSTKNDVCRWQNQKRKGADGRVRGNGILIFISHLPALKQPSSGFRSRRGPHLPRGWGACTSAAEGLDLTLGRAEPSSPAMFLLSCLVGDRRRDANWSCRVWPARLLDLLFKPMETGWGILRLRSKGLLAGTLLSKPWSMQHLRSTEGPTLQSQ